jgi:hypothetical protein
MVVGKAEALVLLLRMAQMTLRLMQKDNIKTLSLKEADSSKRRTGGVSLVLFGDLAKR